jgi:hypothetical protein
VTSGGEEAEAVLVVGVEQPFAFVESAISFIWTLSEYCHLLDQLPLGMRLWGEHVRNNLQVASYAKNTTFKPFPLFTVS